MTLIEHLEAIDTIIMDMRQREAECLLMMAQEGGLGLALGTGLDAHHQAWIFHGQDGLPDNIRDDAGHQAWYYHGHDGLPDTYRDDSGHQAHIYHGQDGLPDTVQIDT